MAKQQLNKKKANRPFIKEMDANPVNENKKQRSVHGKRRLMIVAAGLFITIFFAWKNIQNHVAIASLNKDLQVAKETLEVNEDYQEELNESIKLLEDEEYVAKIARSEYFMTKDDEVVFNFVGESDNFSQDMNKKQDEFNNKKGELKDSSEDKSKQ